MAVLKLRDSLVERKENPIKQDAMENSFCYLLKKQYFPFEGDWLSLFAWKNIRIGK